MSKSMKITRGEMCECGKSVGFDGTKVYDWLEKNSVVVGRGRPSKSKVVEQDSESEDLFASLVKSSTFEKVEQNHGGGAPVNPPTEDLVQKVGDDETLEKAAIKEAKEADKAAKELEKEAKAAEKEAKAVEKAVKLAEKEAKKQEVEDAKAAKLAEKEAKEQEKAAKLAEKEAKEQEKAAKLAEKESKKQEIEDAKAAKLAEKEAKEQEKAAKLAEKASKEQEKILEKASKEQEKATKLAEKEAKSLLKKENKTLKEPKKKEEPKAIEEAVVGAVEGVYGGSAPVEEEDSVIEMVYEGKKYLKSVISGVVYDMDENEIGTWKNDKIVLNDSSGSEEEEEEYN
jgi:chemotaxis protein histidine kinase CheA